MVTTLPCLDIFSINARNAFEKLNVENKKEVIDWAKERFKAIPNSILGDVSVNCERSPIKDLMLMTFTHCDDLQSPLFIIHQITKGGVSHGQ
jgi:hypothetical protein